MINATDTHSLNKDLTCSKEWPIEYDNILRPKPFGEVIGKQLRRYFRKIFKVLDRTLSFPGAHATKQSASRLQGSTSNDARKIQNCVRRCSLGYKPTASHTTPGRWIVVTPPRCPQYYHLMQIKQELIEQLSIENEAQLFRQILRNLCYDHNHNKCDKRRRKGRRQVQIGLPSSPAFKEVFRTLRKAKCCAAECNKLYHVYVVHGFPQFRRMSTLSQCLYPSATDPMIYATSFIHGKRRQATMHGTPLHDRLWQDARNTMYLGWHITCTHHIQRERDRSLNDTRQSKWNPSSHLSTQKTKKEWSSTTPHSTTQKPLNGNVTPMILSSTRCVLKSKKKKHSVKVKKDTIYGILIIMFLLFGAIGAAFLRDRNIPAQWG